MNKITNRVRELADRDSMQRRVFFNSYLIPRYGLSSLYGATYFIGRHTPFDLTFIDWDFYSNYFDIEE